MDLLVIVLVPVVLFGGALGYAMWWRATVGPKLWGQFLARTASESKASPDLPLEEQAKIVMSGFSIGGAKRGPWILPVDDGKIRYVATIQTVNEGNRQVIRSSENWTLHAAQPLGFGLQIAEKTFANPTYMAQLAAQALGKRRTWSQVFPGLALTGDATFDLRFLVLTDNPQAAVRALSDPTIRSRLINLPEVDLVARGSTVAYDDPSGRNRVVAVGYTASPTLLLQREPPMHAAVCDMLVAVHRGIR